MKMKSDDFGAFQKITKTLSHDKIFLHIFLGHFMIPRVYCFVDFRNAGVIDPQNFPMSMEFDS